MQRRAPSRAVRSAEAEGAIVCWTVERYDDRDQGAGAGRIRHGSDGRPMVQEAGRSRQCGRAAGRAGDRQGHRRGAGTRPQACCPTSRWRKARRLPSAACWAPSRKGPVLLRSRPRRQTRSPRWRRPSRRLLPRRLRCKGDMPPAPAARKMMEEKGLSAGDVQGSGRRGQVLKEDVMVAAVRPAGPAATAGRGRGRRLRADDDHVGRRRPAARTVGAQ